MGGFRTRKVLQAGTLAVGLALAVPILRSASAAAAEIGSGRPGDTIAVDVGGAAPGRRITAELAGATFTAGSDRSGRARIEIVVPDVTPGMHTLRLRGGLVGDLPFRVDAPVPAAAPEPVSVQRLQSAPAPVQGTDAATVPDVAGLLAGSGLLLAGGGTLAAVAVVTRRRGRRVGPPRVAAPGSGPAADTARLWVPPAGDVTLPL